MAKSKDPILVERPIITEVIQLYMKTKDQPVTMKEAQEFFLNFQKNSNAPKCVRELIFQKDLEGNLYSEDLSVYIRFIGALQRNPQYS